MNPGSNSVPSELVYNLCSIGNYDECILLIESENCDLNKCREGKDSLIKTTLKEFIKYFELDNSIVSPKIKENPYMKMVSYLTNRGCVYDGECIHLALFQDIPMFSVEDFFDLISNEQNMYPVHNCLEISHLCQNNMDQYICYTKEYQYLKQLCDNYVAEILDFCKNMEEAREVMLLLKNDKTTLDLAVENENKGYISHRFVQKEFQNKWNGVTEGYNFYQKILYTISFVFIKDTYSWYNTPCIKFYLHTVFNLIFLIFLQLQTSTVTDVVPTNVEILMFIWILGMYIVEANQIRIIGFQKYLEDEWNKIDIFIILLYTVIILMRTVIYKSYSDDNDLTDMIIYCEHLLVVNIILSYIRILNICMVHHILGPILLMIGKMMGDMFRFFSILSIFFTGFSLGITKVYHRIGEEHAYGTIHKTITSLLCALFGDFSLDDLTAPGNPEIESFGMTIFFVYMIVLIIILVNLFIAILSNTYAIIQDDSETEWKYARVCLISTYNIYTITPPPLNIIECIYNCFNTSNSIQVSPYYIDTPDSRQNTSSTQKVVGKYYNRKQLDRENNLLEEINQKLNSLLINLKLKV